MIQLFLGFIRRILQVFTGVGHSIEDCVLSSQVGYGGTSRAAKKTIATGP
jgi:hypothetical protein